MSDINDVYVFKLDLNRKVFSGIDTNIAKRNASLIRFSIV